MTETCQVPSVSRVIHIDVELLPEGVYLATSEDVQGLLAQAETLDEVVKLVPDLIQMLNEVDVNYGWAEPQTEPAVLNYRYSTPLAA